MAGPSSGVPARGPVQRMLVQMKSAAEEVTDLLSYGLMDWSVTDADAM
jgi:hypothetical protein